MIDDVRVDADAPEEKLQELINYADPIAHIQNTLPVGAPIRPEYDKRHPNL